MPKKREVPYKMDVKKLKEKDHLILTPEHTVRKDKLCWILSYRPEYKYNEKADLYIFTSTHDTYHNSLSAVVKAMSGDLMYYACKKYKNNLQDLNKILLEHRNQIQNLIGIIDPEANIVKVISTKVKEPKEKVEVKTEETDFDIP